MKRELKALYKKDKKLATEVAQALGYKVKVKSTTLYASLSDDASEIYDYVMNDSSIYQRAYSPILVNLIKKVLVGKYDTNLALKSFINLTAYAAKAYAKEFKGPVFSTSIRKEAAKELLANFEDLLSSGELDHFVAKAVPVGIKRNGEAMQETIKQIPTGLKKKRNIIVEVKKKIGIKGFVQKIAKKDIVLAKKVTKVLQER